ncbi:MAG: hypothetical protein NC433_05005 [Clostridiales bacterium]|nr:hypothetical protein [Clostridiales bacterium]
MKNLKKFLALTLSASMALGMSMTSMAAEPEVSVDAPIYAYDITNVVVPTNYVVAFNPSGLEVTKNGTGVHDQIVSKNYGIINKSTQDKIITVTLKVEDLNEDKITFATDPADVTNAAADDYVVNLKLVPAKDSTIQVGATPADIDLTTTGADLANVTMTLAEDANSQTLVAGENEVDFVLEKAKYTGAIDLDATATNDVKDNFTLSALADSNKGITAFTLSGTMNTNTDWTKLTKGIRITAVYSNENAPSGATAVTGTGALYVNPNPTFKTGAEVGTIKYRKGTGNDALASITKIEMDYGGAVYDGYNALGSTWPAAKDENGLITLPAKYVSNYQGKFPNDMTREATVYYTTEGGAEKTATVDVRLRKPVTVAPSFTTGTVIGTISYTVGTGNDALASIKKVEMDYGGTVYDGYNALGSSWAAATDENGLITLPTKYVTNYQTKFPSETAREATITYVTVGGETKTATVNVKLK